MGYKEWYGFRYYPLPGPGTYRIGVRLENLFTGPALQTEPVEVCVKRDLPG